MIYSRALAGLALAMPALAIPPPDFGFPEAPNDTALSVRFQGQKTDVQEAALYGINIPETAPTLSVNTTDYRSLAEYDGDYTVIMVDPDASYPENPNKRFYLHWMQPNMTQSTATLFGNHMLENSTMPVAPYARPAPPTNSSAHRYIIYAFQQPSNFSIPTEWSGLSATNRSSFNLTNFIDDTGLGTPAAAMYFYVSNQTSVPTTFSAAPSATYPGGDGMAITSGDPYKPTAAASMPGSGGSGSSMSSSAGAAMITGAGSLLGAGIVGIAALI